MQTKYEGHPESKESLHIQSEKPVLLQPIIGFWCSVWCWKLSHAVAHQTLSHGKCRDSCGHGCADWETRQLWGAKFCFLQADEILGYLAEEASSRVELFNCTTVHVRMLPRHKPCYLSNSIGTSSSILHTVRAWHRRTFSCFQKMKQHLAGKRFANDEDLKDAGWITRWPQGMKRVYINWCQGTISALMSKVTLWKSFCIIIKEYLNIAKRSLLYGQPSYFSCYAI